MTRAAIYLRQSLDRDSRQEGIDRQRDRCRKLADAYGWEVVAEYVDNDVSASKPRGAGTAWHRLTTQDAERLDVLISVDLDRLLRTQRDLITLVDLGVKLVTVDGEVNLATADGEFRATMTTALARFETRRKGERQKRANEARRSKGLPAGGRRAFGYEPLAKGAAGITATRTAPDGRTWPAYGHEPREPEATAVRRGFELLLSGASTASIARDWNAAGLRTTQGGEWLRFSVRDVLSNPRYAGLVAPPRPADDLGHAAHNLSLTDLDAGTWEPLVAPETWAAARDLLADPARRTNPGGRSRWLLSGIAKCGLCGAGMKAGRTTQHALYRCSAAAHLARKRDDADHYVTELVVARLSRPDARDLLAARDAPDVDRLRADLRTAQEGEANVASMVARGLLTKRAAESALREVRQRIGDLSAALSDAGKVDVLGPLVEGEARAVWEALHVDRQRAVVGALMAIEMRSPGRGSRAPRDPEGRLAHTAATMTIRWHE